MKYLKKQNSLINSLTFIWKYLPSKRKKQGFALFFGMAGFAGVETLTVGCIAFYITAVSNPTSAKLELINFVAHHFEKTISVQVFELIIFLSSAVVVLVLAKNSLLALITYANAKFSESISAYFGEKLYSGFLYMPYEWHVHQNSADLILGVNWRVFIGKFVKSFIQLLRDILVVSVLLLTMFAVEPIISLSIFLILGSFSFIIFKKIRTVLDKTTVKSKDFKQIINRDVTRGLHAIRDIKVFDQEKSSLYDFIKKIKISIHINTLQTFMTGSSVWIMETFAFFMLASAICFMYFIIDASTSQVTGTVALLVVTAWRILPAISRILSSLTQIRIALPYAQKSFDYLEEISKNAYINLRSQNIHEEELLFDKQIQVESVSFCYKDREKYALHDISFTIKKGQSVGIVGISGAGKSTLVDLLVGLLPLKTGQIIIDGRPLTKNLRIAWLNKIGYVPQAPYIFDGSLCENIAFSFNSSEIDRKRVLEICEMAAMNEVLNDLPEGIDTIIGERGVRLSGGQNQRVAIARALYRNPEIMIFDEATSSLDSKSEKAIQRTIDNFKGKETLIIIAHRLTTVEDCDFLIWIEDGAIKMQAPPKEILPIYAKTNLAWNLSKSNFQKYRSD